MVGGAMFDNYQRRVLYSSTATIESSGYLLNMTNWASMTIPAHLAPANFDAHALCKFLPPTPHMPLLLCSLMCCAT